MPVSLTDPWTFDVEKMNENYIGNTKLYKYILVILIPIILFVVGVKISSRIIGENYSGYLGYLAGDNVPKSYATSGPPPGSWSRGTFFDWHAYTYTWYVWLPIVIVVIVLDSIICRSIKKDRFIEHTH